MATDSLKESNRRCSMFHVKHLVIGHTIHEFILLLGILFKNTMDIRRIIPHMAIKLRRIVMIQFSAVT